MDVETVSIFEGLYTSIRRKITAHSRKNNQTSFQLLLTGFQHWYLMRLVRYWAYERVIGTRGFLQARYPCTAGRWPISLSTSASVSARDVETVSIFEDLYTKKKYCSQPQEQSNVIPTTAHRFSSLVFDGYLCFGVCKGRRDGFDVRGLVYEKTLLLTAAKSIKRHSNLYCTPGFVTGV